MAKAQNLRQTDSTSVQSSEKFANTRKHEVLLQIERLRREFSELSQNSTRRDFEVRDAFTTEALGTITEEIARIAKNESLSSLQRLEELRHIQKIASDAADKLQPRIPDKAPLLWTNRNKEDNIHPFVFAHQVYGDAASIMVVSDYDKLDHALGSILERYKREGKFIPEGYYIKSKSERDRELIANPPTWTELMQQLPADLQRQFRAHRTAMVKKTPKRTV